MNEDQVSDFLCNYLLKHGRLKDDQKDVVVTQNLFRNKVLDSFGFVDLILMVEREFEVNLDLSSFEEEINQTIQGLAKLIVEKMT